MCFYSCACPIGGVKSVFVPPGLKPRLQTQRPLPGSNAADDRHWLCLSDSGSRRLLPGYKHKDPCRGLMQRMIGIGCPFEPAFIFPLPSVLPASPHRSCLSIGGLPGSQNRSVAYRRWSHLWMPHSRFRYNSRM